jgi:hypothetical protein
MRKGFSWLPTAAASLAVSRTRMTLFFAAAGLLLLNLIALFLYLAPPGGTQRELRAESESLKVQLRAARTGTARVESVAAKVQSGSIEASDFGKRYFLRKRLAYDAVLSELQRMAEESGLKSREAVFAEEPIEGSTDLSVMNATANFEGPYESLMKFLYQVDKSPMLLMLDTLQAAPQQRGGVVNASIRFQAIIRDDSNVVEGVRQ